VLTKLGSTDSHLGSTSFRLCGRRTVVPPHFISDSPGNRGRP
jgi:hypothetical protein